MKRLFLILSLFSFLALSHSARGEHSSGGSGGRTIQVPAIGAGQRLGELTNACFAGRAFPPLQYKTIQIEDDVLPTLPSVPSVPPAGGTPPNDGGGTPPAGGGGGPGSGPGTVDGSTVFQNRCVSCHASFSAGQAAEVARRTSLGSTDAEHMPKGGASLSEDERQALISFVQSQ